MDKATPSSSWDWDRFIQACIADGVPEHSLRWYVLRIELILPRFRGHLHKVDNSEIGRLEMSERRSRRQYSDEYKSEAVRLANDSGKAVTQVARELGVNANVLHRWMREEREAGAAGKTRGAVKAEQEEVVRLRRELARVTQERDFLKRAAAFFAKEHK
nr:MAG: hypothetical protein DIU57_15910 [Pseudomonadota bacterium]